MGFRDAADAERTVEAAGAAGALDVVRAALAPPTAVDPTAAPAGAFNGAAIAVGGDVSSADADPNSIAGDGDAEPAGSGAAGVLAERLARKAELQKEQRLAAMDKYERRRHALEQQLRAPGGVGDSGAAPDITGATLGAAAGAHSSAHKEQHAGMRHVDSTVVGGEQRERQGGSAAASSAGRKRAAEDKIAAARARAKERKANL